MKGLRLKRIAFFILMTMLLNSLVVLADLGTNTELGSGNIESRDVKEETLEEDLSSNKMDGEENKPVETKDEESTLPVEDKEEVKNKEDIKDEEEVKEKEDSNIDNDSTIKINIVYKLVNNGIGSQQDLPASFEKDYMKAITDGDILIKDLLNFAKDPKVALDFSSEDYNYFMKEIKIGKLTISRDQYNTKKLKDVTDKFDIFDGNPDIEIYMEGKDREKIKNINIKVIGIDKYHKDSQGNPKKLGPKNEVMSVKYTGSEPNITIGFTNDDEKITFKEGESNIKTMTFDGYKIETVNQIKAENDSYEYEAELKPKELGSLNGVYTVSEFKFNNKYNGEKISIYLKKDASDYFLTKESNGEKTADGILDNGLVDIKINNRSDSPSLPAEKLYIDDDILVDIKDEEKFIKKALGDDYEFEFFLSGVVDKKIKITNTGLLDSRFIADFDYERISYKVRVNGGEIQTFDLMKKDTKSIKFDSDKITSVTINGAVEDLKGKNIDVSKLKDDDIIHIDSTEDLKAYDYSVQNRIFGSGEKLYAARKFQGLEGLSLLVNPIKQHDYKDGKEVIIKDYKLADRFEKEVIVGKDKEVSFYFTPRGKVRYKALYITRYDGDWHSSSDTNYAIEMGKDDEYKILHETEIFIDDSGKPISLVPKLFNDGNLELIKLEKPIEKDMFIDGYNGKVFDGYQYISYVSDPVMQVPNADTVFIFSYKQKANKPSDLVKFQLKETVDEARAKPGYSDGGSSIVDLEYPRYKDDYTVELSVNKSRFSCKEELRLFINDNPESLVDFTAVNKENPVKILDGAYIIKIDGDKNTVGEITFTILIKGSGEDDGDLFPRLKEKSNIKTFNSFTDIGTFALENTSSDPDAFIGIEMNYTGTKGNVCEPTPSLVKSEVKIIKSELIDSKPKGLSGSWNESTIKTLSGSKIDLNVLEKENGNPVIGKYREDITRDENNTSYVYEAEREGKFIGVMNSEGEEINQDGKLLGKDTDIFITQDKSMNIYLNYKKEIPEEIEKTKFKFKTSYLYVEMPEDLISDFGVKTNNKQVEQEKYLEDLKLDIENFYKERKATREEYLIEADNAIKAYYALNKTEPNINDDLKKLKEVAKKVQYEDYRRQLLSTIDNLMSLGQDAPDLAGNPEVKFEDVEYKIENLNRNEKQDYLLNYLTEKGYKVISLDDKANDLIREDKFHYIKHYDKDIYITNYSYPRVPHPYSETHDYLEYKKEDYTLLPVSISKDMLDYDKIFNKFIGFGDAKEGFYLRNKEEAEKMPNWKAFIEAEADELTKVEYGFEADNNIPVIFLQRSSRNWELEKKTDKPEPPEKTDRGLDIIYRFFDKDGNQINKGTETIISYRDLPSYINRLGWKINDFKENGYTYMDDGRGLKEGDIKYSDQLKNGKTTTLYLDYKGDGEIPSIDDSKYEYTVFHQEIDLDNLSALPKPIETFISKDKYPVGTVLSIGPSNREADGYVLLDENNQITNDYSSKDIEIKDEKKLGKEANYYFYRYAKVKEPDLKTVYKVEYTDANYNELAKSEMKKIQADVKTIKESAKYISSYKARIQNIDLKIDKIDNIEPIIHFIGQTGYTIKHEDGKYKLMRDNLVCAEIFKKSGENTLRFIYDVDNTPRGAEIVYDANNGNFGDSTSINRVNGEIGKRVASHSPSKTVRRSGYSFVRWTYDRNGSERLDDRIVKNGDYITLYAQWSKDSTGGGGGGGGGNPDPKKPKEDKGKIIEPKIEYELNKTDHFAYIKGYPDITVQPNGYITREEVAMVFYRLMEPEYRKTIDTTSHNYKDVKDGTWSTKAIATLSNGGLLKGYGDDTFKPHERMTRAEISKVIARFTDTVVLDTEMPDIIGHWAENYINTAQSKGWVKGYADGTFKPDELLTRAEFVTMVNSLLDRKVKKQNALAGLKQFKDLPENWYYEQMIEAINGHEYKDERLSDGTEVWTKLVDTQFPD